METVIKPKLLSLVRLLWSCLWAIPICWLLISSPAIAAPQDVDFGAAHDCPAASNTEYPINVSTNGSVNLDIGVLNSPNNTVQWSFDSSPTPVAGSPACSGSGTSYICSNVNITIPTGQVILGQPNTTVRVNSASASPAGSYNFDLAVDPQGPITECIRPYRLNVRQPFDMSFVLDRSGSMGSSTNVTPPAIDRWDALKKGVAGFIPFIRTEAPDGSRFGVTLFSTNVLSNNSFPSTLVNIDNNLLNSVNNELTSQTPDGWTAMGAGLKAGIAKLTDTSRPRVVVLFTDGEQNQPPEVNLDGHGYSDGTSINPSYPAGPGSVKIVTVGVGAPSGNYLTTLQNLATENRGVPIITSNGCDFIPPGAVVTNVCPGNVEDAFNYAIAPTLSGNSPLMVNAFGGVLSTDSVTLPAFDINKNLEQLLIKLSFSRNFEAPEWGRLLADLHILKDGIDVTQYFQPIILGNYTNSVILRTDFVMQSDTSALPERIDSEGSYSIELSKPRYIEEDLDYRIIPYADDSRLDMEWKVNPTLPRVNQSFQPTVNLHWQGVPITNANVEAFILKPGDDLGDILAKNSQKVDPRNAPDAGSPGYQKYLYLLQNDPDFLKQLAFSQNQQTLSHRGNGRYTANYNPGDVSGIYQIFYRIRANDPETNSPIERFAVESAYVRFGEIDLANSAVNTTVRDNTILINWRPITTSGRFIGPDQGTAISVTGINLTNVQDNQDGSYTLTLTGDPTAPITVDVLGEEIYQGPAGQFGKGHKKESWLIVLIVILVLLLLVLLLWLWKRYSTSTSESEASNTEEDSHEEGNSES